MLFRSDSQYKYVDIATNRVYNVITVIGIFFTVFVLVITIYQYLKSKTYEDKIDILESEIEKSSKDFQLKIDKYNVEIKELVNANILFVNALNLFNSKEYSKAAMEFEKLINLLNSIAEFHKIFDMEQIKKSTVLSYKNAKDFLGAAKHQKSLFNIDNIVSEKNFLDYLDYCNLKLIYATESDKINELIEVEELFKNALEITKRLNLFDLESGVKANLNDVRLQIGAWNYYQNNKEDAMKYLKLGFSNLYMQSDYRHKKYILLLVKMYLENDEQYIMDRFEDFFDYYDYLIEIKGKDIYIDNHFENETECTLDRHINIIYNVLKYYSHLIEHDTATLSQFQLLRKMFLVSKIHEKLLVYNVLEQIKNDNRIVKYLEKASQLYNDDRIVERNTGINPFSDHAKYNAL